MENKIENRRSMRTDEFINAFKKLGADDRKLAKEVFKQWKTGSAQVSFMALGQTNNLFWRAKVSDGIRAVARKTKDHEGNNFYIWTWIGSREDFKNDLKKLAASKNISDIANRLRGDTSHSKKTKKIK